MPTYAYGCDNCGVRFDRYQGYDDPPLTECPECGEDALRKLFTPVGVVFKGSGFYSTDHRSPSGQGTSRRSDDSESDKGESSKSPKAKPGKEAKPSAAAEEGHAKSDPKA
jgi:putative FmdB family regulatory protein